nr:MAG TPA: hypothetical protein [Caudoviricetes sp.]
MGMSLGIALLYSYSLYMTFRFYIWSTVEYRPARCPLLMILRHLSSLLDILIYPHKQFFLLSQPHPI